MNSTKLLASSLVFASATAFSITAYADTANSTLDRAASHIQSRWERERDRHFDTRRPAIAGMWLTSLYAGPFKGPDSVRGDLAIQQFSSDGNELMNSSGFDPKTGVHCYGVWKDLGNNTFKIRHLGWGFDANGKHLDTTRLNFNITVSEDRNTYSGTYTADLIDMNGQVVPGSFAEGDVRAVRFEVDGIDVAPVIVGETLAVKSLASGGTSRRKIC